MSRNLRLPVTSSAKQTKREQEMTVLRAHHESLLRNDSLREATLVGAGVFVRASDGTLVVAEPYSKVISPKRAA